jgi:hypothetical protein
MISSPARTIEAIANARPIGPPSYFQRAQSYSLPFPRFFRQKHRHPTPLPYGKRLFDRRFARNLNGFNIMHFRPVDESVTTNPVFCPLFGQKGSHYGQNSPYFRVS